MNYKKSKLWRCAVADFTYRFSGEPIRKLIDEDVYRYLKWNDDMKDKTALTRLNCCLISHEEFRNVFYYRMIHHPHLTTLSGLFLPKAPGVEIGGVIDGGFYVSHKHSVVVPGKAGKNLRVGPGVVIGRSLDGWPQIGDNVYIASNSTVVGNVHIGSNVIIGAGSVVVKDIPDDSVYVGNPAHFIKKVSDDPKLLDEIM